MEKGELMKMEGGQEVVGMDLVPFYWFLMIILVMAS